MRENDTAFAVFLTDLEQWGNLVTDFKRLITLDPLGCFIARMDGQPAGMVTTTTCDDYAFIGNLIVLPEFRNRGIGGGLMRHAFKYLKGKGARTIELDATNEGAPLYRRLGFIDKYVSLRLWRKGCQTTPAPSPPVKVSVPRATALDARLTGLNRKTIIEQFAREFGPPAGVVRSGRLAAFAFVYARAGNLVGAGPLVAEDQPAAEELLDTIVARHGKSDIRIGLPETKQEFVKILRQHQFTFQTPCVRMYLGLRRDYEESVYGIISPEKG